MQEGSIPGMRGLPKIHKKRDKNETGGKRQSDSTGKPRGGDGKGVQNNKKQTEEKKL